MPDTPAVPDTADPLINLGSMLNSGLEITTNARLLTRENLAFEMRAAFNTLHNEVLDLGDSPETRIGRDTVPENGGTDLGSRSQE